MASPVSFMQVLWNGGIMNHLENEKSPYLKQHRNQPVDWYPWCEEAFQKAERENKPIFLSIGYSTCHWCHVMAHESFEDNEVAEMLNRFFVPVKVDREERPDVDHVYMSVCQALTGAGGWPLTIFLTPDKKPFFAATYLPKHSQYGRIGLIELLGQIVVRWEEDKEFLIRSGEQIVSALNEMVPEDSEEDTEVLLERGINERKADYDSDWGGFGYAPKFPTPHQLLFLMRVGVERNDTVCLKMVEHTLDMMSRGGIFDHLGGGFSRYSTDEKWLIPHFEKMLYDNALLAETYLEAYVILKKSYYKRIVKKILDYTEREMMAQDGGFFGSQDADSEGEEGRYYVFSKKEIEQILGADAEEFCRWFGITQNGNFEGKNVLNLLENNHYETVPANLETMCQKLYQYRIRRAYLHRDDKILTSWNSMMIRSFAKAGFVLGEERYIQIAKQAQEKIEHALTNEDGRLFVRYCDGEAAGLGNLDDYANQCLGLITLYKVTMEAGYLEQAVRCAAQMIELFWDDERGGFFFSGKDAERLIHRTKETLDGAVPSGNAVAAHVLFKLSRLTGEKRWTEYYNRQMEFLSGAAARYPSGHGFSLMALLNSRTAGMELVCLSAENHIPEELIRVLREHDMNQMTIMFKCPQNEAILAEIAPFTRDYAIPGQGVQYYLCKNNTCSSPFSDIRMLKKYLK